MPDTKISALAAAGTLDGTEIVPLLQGGANKRGTVAGIVARVLAALGGMANGLASLDGTGKVPAAQLPAGTGGASPVGTATPLTDAATIAAPDASALAGSNDLFRLQLTNAVGATRTLNIPTDANVTTGKVRAIPVEIVQPSSGSGCQVLLAETGGNVVPPTLWIDPTNNAATLVNFYRRGGSTTVFHDGLAAAPLVKVAASGAAQALTFPASGRTTYDITLTANCTLTLAGLAAGTAEQEIRVYLRQDATAGRAVTLPTGVRWPGGIAPTPGTAAGGIDVFRFSSPDGVTVFGDY